MEEQNLKPDQQSESAVKPLVGKGRMVANFLEKNFLGLSILIAGALVSFSVLYSGGAIKLGTAKIDPGIGQQRPAVKTDVSVDDDPVLGNKNAPVTIIEFSDYQCPFCRSFWKDSLPQIKKEFIDTGKARFVYRDFALSAHPMAIPSAQAAECADDQGKYWEMHDKIFSEQGKLGQGTVTYAVSDLKKWAIEIGLNAVKFNGCLDSGKYKAEVDKDFADGSAAGVTGTPSLFINGRLVVGAQPFASFKAVIEEELKKK